MKKFFKVKRWQVPIIIFLLYFYICLITATHSIIYEEGRLKAPIQDFNPWGWFAQTGKINPRENLTLIPLHNENPKILEFIDKKHINKT